MPTRSQTRKAPPRFAVRSATWLRQLLLRGADRMLPTHLAVLEHSHQFAKAHILATMAELGVADHLADGPRSADELATSMECDADALHRLLRAAAVSSLVRLDQKGRFHATRFTDVLRSDHESGAADWCRYIGSSAQQSAWLGLTESVRTGRSAFRRVHGVSMFEWFDAHPDEGRHFSAGLGGLTLAEAPAIIGGYPFPETGVVCDLAAARESSSAPCSMRARTCAVSWSTAQRSSTRRVATCGAAGSSTGSSWSRAICWGGSRPRPTSTCSSGSCTTGTTRRACGSCVRSRRRCTQGRAWSSSKGVSSATWLTRASR